DGDDDDGGGRLWLPEGVEARGGEWIWGSGRSGHEDNIWFRQERSPENFSSGGDMVAGGKGGRKFWRGRVFYKCVSGKAEKLSGISFHIKLL
ncbi:hypothetical protein Tco_0260286, partial [Tanacetum coccineum]